MANSRICSVDGCDKPHLARGYCNAHYLRWKSHGSPLAEIPVVEVVKRDPGMVCEVPDCGKPAQHRGWCKAHYHRWHRHGDPLTNKRHGHSPKGKKTPTYNSWKSMKARCTSTTRDNAKHYALAGIAYDPRWEDFENFLADMGERPKGTTLDREENALGYSKDNCRWATPTQQTRNRRIARTFEFEGRTLSIAEWAEEFGITYGSAVYRIKRYKSLRLPDGVHTICGVQS